MGMARLARIVIPGMPHHVTQRGNRRQQTFFNDGDYAAYLELMVEWCNKEGVAIWAFCCMPKHTHLIAVPSSEEALRRAIGAIRGGSTFVRNGAATSGRGDSRRS
jgi:putative transposase